MSQYTGSSDRGTLPPNNSTRICVVEERARESAETAIIIADTDEPIVYDDMTYHGITNLWSLHMQRLSKERFERPGLSPDDVLRMQPLQRRRHIYLKKLVSFENQLKRSRQAMLDEIQELDKNNISSRGSGDAPSDGGKNLLGSGCEKLPFANGSERTKFIHDWMEASMYEQPFLPTVKRDDPAYERATKPHLELTKEQFHGKYIAPAGRGNSSNWMRSDSSGSG